MSVPRAGEGRAEATERRVGPKERREQQMWADGFVAVQQHGVRRVGLVERRQIERRAAEPVCECNWHLGLGPNLLCRKHRGDRGDRRAAPAQPESASLALPCTCRDDDAPGAFCGVHGRLVYPPRESQGAESAPLIIEYAAVAVGPTVHTVSQRAERAPIGPTAALEAIARTIDERAPGATEAGMGWFRKKPVVIQAVQYTQEDAEAVANGRCDDFYGFKPQSVTDEDGATYRTGRLKVQTLESDPNHPHLAEPGDWIIWGVKGEPYPCKPDIFAATYEPASAPQPPPPAEAPSEDELVGALENWRRELAHSTHYQGLAVLIGSALARLRAAPLAPADAEPTGYTLESLLHGLIDHPAPEVYYDFERMCWCIDWMAGGNWTVSAEIDPADGSLTWAALLGTFPGRHGSDEEGLRAALVEYNAGYERNGIDFSAPTPPGGPAE